MQLSVTEREQLYAILEKYDQNPKVQQMRATPSEAENFGNSNPVQLRS